MSLFLLYVRTIHLIYYRNQNDTLFALGLLELVNDVNICTFDLSNSLLSLVYEIVQYIGNQINLVKGVFSSYGGMISDEHDIIRVVLHFTLMSEVGQRPCLLRFYC